MNCADFLWFRKQFKKLNAKIDALSKNVQTEGTTMTQEVEALKAEVQRNTDVGNSAIALLNGLAGQIVALKEDPVALQALADSLTANDNALAAAVAANTPAAPAP